MKMSEVLQQLKSPHVKLRRFRVMLVKAKSCFVSPQPRLFLSRYQSSQRIVISQYFCAKNYTIVMPPEYDKSQCKRCLNAFLVSMLSRISRVRDITVMCAVELLKSSVSLNDAVEFCKVQYKVKRELRNQTNN